MIEAYTGTPGSGKSLHTTHDIDFYLRKNRLVVTNFPLNTDYDYCFVPNDKIDPTDLRALAKHYWIKEEEKSKNNKFRIKEDTILLVIDEAQLLFNSRTWSSKGRQAWLDFFSQHRKYGYRVILVCQNLGMLDKQIRQLIEYENIHRKVGNYGLFGKIISIGGLFKLHIVVRVWPAVNQKVGSDFFLARKRYYKYYDTYDVMDDLDSINVIEHTLPLL